MKTETTQHTPGPWTAVTDLHNATVTQSISASHGEIAKVKFMKIDDDEAKANAALIAAAPELLEVLKGRHPFEICSIEDCDACAVIAKAEGQPS